MDCSKANLLQQLWWQSLREPPADAATVPVEPPHSLKQGFRARAGSLGVPAQPSAAGSKAAERVQVLSEDHACIRVAVEQGANEGFQFKTHPNIDKSLYSSRSVLGLKDVDRPFPTGSPLGILKWRMQASPCWAAWEAVQSAP